VTNVSDLSHKRMMRSIDSAALPAHMARLWWAKRAFDVIGALVLLIATAPLFALAAVGVRLSSRGPVLFRQRRVVEHGREITLVKFRTFPVSHVDTVWTLGYQDCPLRIGRLLRRTSIDELPQLWNVLRGDLSLVGPRPERPQFADALCADVPGYRNRQRVPGGITGLAQVSGYWGVSSIHERVRLDNQYIDTWTPMADLVILGSTVIEVVRRAVNPSEPTTAASGAVAWTAEEHAQPWALAPAADTA
jgi:lipopolysaccharide/colanic/teichoic acid biosynthesis glycosyltransferase